MVAYLKLIVKVVGEFLFLFGILAWVYGVLVQLIHPEWLPLSLSHLVPWIRVDTFTIISFVVAAIGFLTWRLSKELRLTQNNITSKVNMENCELPRC